MSTHITLIAAVCHDENHRSRQADILFKTCGLGKNNAMPWHLPEDLAFFKKTTLNHTIVMGRKTFESIGKPLPKRRTIILTRNQQLLVAGAEIAHSIDSVLEMCQSENEIFIVGGAEIYAAFLSKATKLLLTKIDFTAQCDAHFPKLDPTWTQVDSQKHVSLSGLKYEFCEFNVLRVQ